MTTYLVDLIYFNRNGYEKFERQRVRASGPNRAAAMAKQALRNAKPTATDVSVVHVQHSAIQ